MVGVSSENKFAGGQLCWLRARCIGSPWLTLSFKIGLHRGRTGAIELIPGIAGENTQGGAVDEQSLEWYQKAHREFLEA